MSLRNSSKKPKGLGRQTIAFIGGGNMGEALIRGLLAAQTVAPRQLTVADVQTARLRYLAEAVGVRTMTDNRKAVSNADIVLLAVKPQQMREVLSDLRPLPSALFVSIAAGVTTASIEQGLGGKARVVRVMPNTPALVRAGAAALAKGRFATNNDLAIAEAILGAVGVTVRVEERLFNAVTALSGSGPAYVFLLAEAMIKAGVDAGLSADIAKKLTLQTIFGAAKLMLDSGLEPAELRRKVTSPGGTTEAAMKVMAERNLPETFSKAVAAAARRGSELSGA